MRVLDDYLSERSFMASFFLFSMLRGHIPNLDAAPQVVASAFALADEFLTRSKELPDGKVSDPAS